MQFGIPNRDVVFRLPLSIELCLYNRRNFYKKQLPHALNPSIAIVIFGFTAGCEDNTHHASMFFPHGIVALFDYTSIIG